MFVYILLCNNGTTYTGVTHNLFKRFDAHKFGYGSNYTRKHGANKILYVEYYPTEQQALQREVEIKSWHWVSKAQLVHDSLDRPVIIREKNLTTRKWVKLMVPRLGVSSVTSQHFGKIVQGSNFISPKKSWF